LLLEKELREGEQGVTISKKGVNVGLYNIKIEYIAKKVNFTTSKIGVIVIKHLVYLF